MTTKHFMSQKKLFLLLLLCAAGTLLLFRHELVLLRLSDPVQKAVYEYSFKEDGVQNPGIGCRVEGFILTPQGLALPAGAAGTVVFSVHKSPGQGCLLRLWLYGDDGMERPNALRCSVDGGGTFIQLAGSANHIGAVLDITPQVVHAGEFQLACDAVNRTGFSPVVFEKLELVVTADSRTQPALPNLPMIIAALLSVVLFVMILSGTLTGAEKLRGAAVLLLAGAAASLRWNELLRLAGTPLDPDAAEYAAFAKSMALFTDRGFYSASFGIREPMYLLLVKLFYAVFGHSETHLRFVSFVFSIVVVVLTYHVSRVWFNSFVGLCAAVLLTVHPYLVGLSARGLREEWFTALLLCFLYAAFVKKEIAPLWRTITTGVLAGMLLLTRTEYLPALAVIILLLPRIAAAHWQWRHSVVSLLLALLMLMPHLYSVYEKHGTPFDGINKVTRFYVRNERVRSDASDGRPDAETVTPFAYFFKMHTPGQFLRCWVAGFVNIYATMPLQFAYGKGNRDLIRYTLAEAAAHPTPNRIAAACRKLFSILKKDFLSYAAAVSLLALFLAGIVLVALYRCRLVLLLMLVLQMHTSFLAAFGLDPRLTVPAYPLFACCCGVALYRGCRRLAAAIALTRDAAPE